MVKKKTLTKSPGPVDIDEFIRAQNTMCAKICRLLKKEIETALPNANSKLYHGSPVWFVGQNAVVGFSVTAKDSVRLLFWNGQSLGEPELVPVGKFKAAQVTYQNHAQLNFNTLQRWLKKAGKDIWDLAKIRG